MEKLRQQQKRQILSVRSRVLLGELAQQESAAEGTILEEDQVAIKDEKVRQGTKEYAGIKDCKHSLKIRTDQSPPPDQISRQINTTVSRQRQLLPLANQKQAYLQH